MSPSTTPHNNAASPTAGEHLLIVTDAWAPQVNGVVTTIRNLAQQLEERGYQVSLITPEQYWTVPTFYPNLHLAIPGGAGQRITELNPDRILIMTEGPLGLAARHHCVMEGIPFLTGFTTKWAEYFVTHVGFPPRPMGYRYLRWFHRPASGTLVATESLHQHLEGFGFKHLMHWNRGVDTHQFYPLTDDERAAFATTYLPNAELPKPYSVYVGRVSQEKNLDAFMALEIPGTKIVVGTGPYLDELKEKHPNVVFAGLQQGDALRQYYGAADLMVFPSKTDTFGLVMLEALACGTPVLAFDVTGPHDVLANAGTVGQLAQDDDDFQQRAVAMLQARGQQQLTPAECLAIANHYSWDNAVNSLLSQWPNRHTHPAKPFVFGEWLKYRLGAGA